MFIKIGEEIKKVYGKMKPGNRGYSYYLVAGEDGRHPRAILRNFNWELEYLDPVIDTIPEDNFSKSFTWVSTGKHIVEIPNLTTNENAKILLDEDQS